MPEFFITARSFAAPVVSDESAARGRPWWSHIPLLNVVILWAKYGWEGFE